MIAPQREGRTCSHEAAGTANAVMNKSTTPVLTEREITKAYKDTLRTLSITKGTITDATRQSMADAVHEFYRLLKERLDTKRFEATGQAGS